MLANPRRYNKMLIDHATVYQKGLSFQQAYTGFMLTALTLIHEGKSEFAEKAFNAANRYSGAR